ncbi:hypothetical protein OTU49_009280 [Cherax quadricarinatus]|uniref:Lipase domain-containing protein n=1 Tax=Cherax quadricarinatus TaxID=27406 RepID=A0AAW0WLA8_CHEQU
MILNSNLKDKEHNDQMKMRPSLRSYVMNYDTPGLLLLLLNLLLGRDCALANMHHEILPSDAATSHVMPGFEVKGNWSKINHSNLSNVDYYQEKKENTIQSSSLTVKNFFLWTRKNSGNSSQENLDPTEDSTIIKSNFQPRQTYIIIHGFLGFGNEPWILHVKDKLLKVSDCNVISVDWPAGVSWMLLSYYTAVSTVPYVGQDTALLLKSLVAHKALNLKDVHFVGHSLGAHASGLASKPFKGKIGRITGLDPAGLTFHQVPPQERIDSSDAGYVDIMHANSCYNKWNPWGDCYGLNENLGHSDFWPNGGEHQPACQQANVTGDYGCDHMMAYKYYAESFDYGIDKTYFLARNCSDWATYKKGNCSCGDDAQYMGFFVNTRMNGTFYLKTNITSPFALEDAVCSPGNALYVEIQKILVILGAVFSVLVVLGSTVVVGITKGRKQQQVKSSLLTNEEGHEDESQMENESLASEREEGDVFECITDDEFYSDHSGKE